MKRGTSCFTFLIYSLSDFSQRCRQSLMLYYAELKYFVIGTIGKLSTKNIYVIFYCIYDTGNTQLMVKSTFTKITVAALWAFAIYRVNALTECLTDDL